MELGIVEVLEIAATRGLLIEAPEDAVLYIDAMKDAKHQQVREVWRRVEAGDDLAVAIASVGLPDASDQLAILRPELLGAPAASLVEAARDARARERFVEAVAEAQQRLASGEPISRVAEYISDAAAGGAGTDAISLASAINGISAEAIETINTGIASFGRLFGGWPRRQISVVVQPPGTGKTALMFQSALAASSEGHEVLFVSTEMDAVSLLQRQAALRAGVPVWNLSEEAAEKVRQAAEKWRPLLERVSFIETIDVQDVVGAALRVRPDLIIVDHLADMLMTARGANLSDNHGKAKNILSVLKEVARRVNAAVLVAHQTNRPAAIGAEPSYGLIAYTSVIEQYAAVVAMALPDSEDDSLLVGKVLKARFGTAGDYALQKEDGRFSSREIRFVGLGG